MSEESALVGTVAFTDLVGFTQFNDACGDDAALAVLDRIRAVMDAELSADRADAAHAGDGRAAARVVKELGDGLMVWFPDGTDPVASLCRFLAALADERSAGTFPLAVRVGAHHGEVRTRGDDLVGMTANVAARLVDLAGPMEIVVSEAFVRACVGDAPRPDLVEPIGPTDVKGLQDALWLYRVIAPATNYESLPAPG